MLLAVCNTISKKKQKTNRDKSDSLQKSLPSLPLFIPYENHSSIGAVLVSKLTDLRTCMVGDVLMFNSMLSYAQYSIIL